MDDQKEEGEFVSNWEEPAKEAGEEPGVPVKSETLGAKVDVQMKDSNGDANTVDVSDSGVSNSSDVGNGSYTKTNGGENRGDNESCGASSGTDAIRLEMEAREKDNFVVSGEKTEKEDVGRAEEMGDSVHTEVTDSIANPEIEREIVEHNDDSVRAEEMVSSAEVEMEVVVNPMIDRGDSRPCDDAERGEKTVNSVESEMKDDTVAQVIERENGEIDENMETEITLVRSEVKNGDAGDIGETKVVDPEKSSDDAVINGIEGKESVQKSEEDNEKLEVDSENMNSEVEDKKVGPLHEQKVPESETLDAKLSAHVQALEEPDQAAKGKTPAVVDGEELRALEGNACDSTKDSSAEQTTEIDQKEEKGEAMEIDPVEEEHTKEVDKLGSVAENAGKEFADPNSIKTQDVPTRKACKDYSSVEKKIETEKRYVEGQQHEDDKMGDVVVSKDSTDLDNAIEDASTGEVEQMDHNVLFDPNSDIANYIDFSGVSSWSGNIQEIRTDSGNVSREENTEVTDKAKEVVNVNGQKGLKHDMEVQGSLGNVQETVLDKSKGKDTTVNLESPNPSTVDDMEIDREGGDSGNISLGANGFEKVCNEAPVVSDAKSLVVSKETCDADLGSSVGEEDREEKVTEKQKDRISEQEGDAQEAPNFDANQMQDAELEEKHKVSEHDEGTDSDTKTNGVKRKADSLGEDSSENVRNTISVAKVSVSSSHPQRPSFKIGACIARAASQMAGPPSALKDSTFSDDLSVDNFLTQLQSAATDPVKENVVSEIAAGFFLDYRNSMISQQPPPDKVRGKRGRPSNSNIGGTEAFEFEELSDTYWTDRVIHNGGEEQTAPAEKGDYHIVPVELKPAPVQRSRRPYTKRKHAVNNNNNNSLSASDKPRGIDENAPAELIINFSEIDTIPSEISLNKMFKHFGPIRESQTEVDRDTSRARVVFRKCADAEVAYSSAGRFKIFGTKIVNYELSYTITEPFKIQPYVVTLGEEDGSLYHPSQS